MLRFIRGRFGRVGFAACRSRKNILWALCCMTGALLVYIQFISPSTISMTVNEPQQQRSLNSYGHNGRDVYPVRQERVRFLENEVIRPIKKFEQNLMERNINNEVEQRHVDRNMVNEFEEKRVHVDGEFASLDEKPYEERHEAAVKQLEARILDQRAADDNKIDSNLYREDTQKLTDSRIPDNEESRGMAYISAGESWNGGTFKYNPYGEPIYDHNAHPITIPKERMIHLDLKGAPPRPAVYKTLIPWLAKQGATSILLEYEDMFPWEGRLRSLAAKNHYSKLDVVNILNLCKKNGLEVIPLVQTFGHLEYALKGPTFSFLREVPELPLALCPSHNDSQWLVQAMIDQVMALHRKAKYLHIGCDEVYQMGECDICRNKIRENLFLDHVSSTAKYVRETYRVIPIIWHDMLNQISESAMKSYHFGKLVEPMVWVYAEDIYRFMQPSMWSKLAEIFPYVWGASAFKGAFGEQSVVPNVRRHLDNNLNWLDVIASEAPKFSGGFRGLVLTGWQRHDHFAVLCELFPAALPSLAVNLIAISNGYFNESLYKRTYDALNCMQTSDYHSGMNLDSDPFLWEKFSWCFFPGSLIFKTTGRLDASRLDVKSYIDRVTLKRAWLSDYNRRHNFSSPMRIDQDLEELPSRLNSVVMLLKTAKEALLEWFDEWTTGEWIEQHVWPLLHEMETLQAEAESMKLVKTWPARPLPLLPELETYGIYGPRKKRREKKTLYQKSADSNVQRINRYR